MWRFSTAPSWVNRRAVGLVLKLLVSGGLIWLIFRSIDVDEVLVYLRRVSPAVIGLALALGLLQVGFVAVRWIVVIRLIGGRLRLMPAMRISYIGSFFNQILPTSVAGDVARIYLAHKEGLALGRAVSSVLLERGFTVLGLLLLVLTLFPLLMRRASDTGLDAIYPLVLLAAAGGIGGLCLLMVLDQLPAAWLRFRLERVFTGLSFTGLSADARRAFWPPGGGLVAMAVMIVSLLNLCLILWLVGAALGIGLSFVDGAALFPLVLLATAIPLSIGGWGVREGAMVATLGLVGIPPEPAFALSVVFGLIAVVASLPGGLVWFAHGYRRADVEVPDGPTIER